MRRHGRTLTALPQILARKHYPCPSVFSLTPHGRLPIRCVEFLYICFITMSVLKVFHTLRWIRARKKLYYSLVQTQAHSNKHDCTHAHTSGLGQPQNASHSSKVVTTTNTKNTAYIRQCVFYKIKIMFTTGIEK